MLVTGPSTLTYLYGAVSVWTHRLTRAPSVISFPLRESRSVMNQTYPSG